MNKWGYTNGWYISRKWSRNSVISLTRLPTGYSKNSSSFSSTYGSVSCTMYTADKTGCAEQSTNWFQITNNEWDPVQNGKDFNLECNCCDQLILQKTTTYR